MTDDLLKPFWKLGCAVLIVPTLASLRWGPQTAAGVLVGGAWNLINLWCLSRLLGAWLGPQSSTKRVVGWLLIKFLVLYLIAFTLLYYAPVSYVGFVVGFTVVLATAMLFMVLRARRMIVPVSHER